MKTTNIILFISSLCFLPDKSFSQSAYGQANLFYYDNAGNRIQRVWFNHTLIGKTHKGEEVPVDTFTFNRDKHVASIKVYPNPAEDVLNIESSTLSEIDEVIVKIFDISGRFIASAPISQKLDKISLSNLTPGIYQLHYYNRGKYITMWKLIKK